MLRALQLGKLALGTARPNPMVGAVIVHEKKIIGEGFTSCYGGNHAEVNAINAVKNQSLLSESTLYVTLGPCCHYGKTPPCSDLIIEKKIKTVVIGCKDTNEKVAGGGIKRLKDGGCEVIVGILEKECRNNLKRFFTYHEKKRPYIILKWAQTTNGFIAPSTKKENRPVWISDNYSRQLVHRWRVEEQAILVGKNTVIDDNPYLNVRDWTGSNPTKIIIDKSLSLNINRNIFNPEAKCIVFHCDKHKPKTKQPSIIYEALEWIDYQYVTQQICEKLHYHKITSVTIEGGRVTLQSFIDSGLWDEAKILQGKSTFESGVKAPIIHKSIHSKTTLKNDILLTIYNES